jgi:hypothetical protein
MQRDKYIWVMGVGGFITGSASEGLEVQTITANSIWPIASAQLLRFEKFLFE